MSQEHIRYIKNIYIWVLLTTYCSVNTWTHPPQVSLIGILSLFFCFSVKGLKLDNVPLGLRTPLWFSLWHSLPPFQQQGNIINYPRLLLWIDYLKEHRGIQHTLMAHLNCNACISIILYIYIYAQRTNLIRDSKMAHRHTDTQTNNVQINTSITLNYHTPWPF